MDKPISKILQRSVEICRVCDLYILYLEWQSSLKFVELHWQLFQHFDCTTAIFVALRHVVVARIFWRCVFQQPLWVGANLPTSTIAKIFCQGLGINKEVNCQEFVICFGYITSLTSGQFLRNLSMFCQFPSRTKLSASNRDENTGINYQSPFNMDPS